MSFRTKLAIYYSSIWIEFAFKSWKNSFLFIYQLLRALNATVHKFVVHPVNVWICKCKIALQSFDTQMYNEHLKVPRKQAFNVILDHFWACTGKDTFITGYCMLWFFLSPSRLLLLKVGWEVVFFSKCSVKIHKRNLFYFSHNHLKLWYKWSCEK